MYNSKYILSQLERRANSVLNSNESSFSNEIKIFYDFIKSNNKFKSILKEIELVKFDSKQYLDDNDRNNPQGPIVFPNNYMNKIALCDTIMKEFMNKNFNCLQSKFSNITSSNNTNYICTEIANRYFNPLYEYFCEQVEEYNNILYLLNKYRHRTEWFHKERLFNAYKKNTAHGEEILTKDLQEYLYDQGIDFPFSTPLTPSGRADIVGQIEEKEEDPLVLEIKLFNLEKNYDKSYIRKGLMQASRYALDYGKPTGYLLVFNLSNKGIEFENIGNNNFKEIEIGEKTIFIICVNLYPSESASKIKNLSIYTIEDSYLKGKEEKDR
jgi:hypothetical protein